MILALIALTVLTPQEPVAEFTSAPTPPPNRYDLARDAWLAREWEDLDRLDADLAPQAPSLRPKLWTLYASVHLPTLERALVETNASPDALTGDSAHGASKERLIEGPFAAVASIHSDRDEVRFARAPGARLVLVNGVAVPGDPGLEGGLGYPVALHAGENTIWLVDIQSTFEFELWKPVPRLVIASWALLDRTEEPNGEFRTRSGFIGVPIFNASTDAALQAHFHYGSPKPEGGALPFCNEWHDGTRIAPLGITFQESSIIPNASPTSAPAPSGRVLAPLEVYDETDAHADRCLAALGAPRPPHKEGPPPALQARGFDPTRVVLVYETTGNPELNAQALAAARYWQAEFFRRTGRAPKLVEDSWLEAGPLPSGPIATGGLVIRFGPLRKSEGQGLVFTAPAPKEGELAEASIRAATPGAMRWVYFRRPLLDTWEGGSIR